MVATLIIVFREVIEAGLIVGIVLAASGGAAGRGLWVSYGIAAGVLGACVVAAFSRTIAGAFAGSGQELFNASVLMLAVLMLGWHNVWMARHGRAMAADVKVVGEAVAAGQRPLAALAVVVGIAVLREGAEVVLFLYGIAAGSGASSLAMLGGGAIGVLLGAGVSALIYFGLLGVPTRYLFAVTSGLIALLAAGMASQAVAFLWQAGLVNVLGQTVWDTSAILPESSVVGMVAHTLIGYTAAPSALQLIVYVATLATILILMRLIGSSEPPRRASESDESSTAKARHAAGE